MYSLKFFRFIFLFFLNFLIFISQDSWADAPITPVNNPITIPNTLPINYRIDYLQLRIPDQTNSLGLLGLHAQITPFKNTLPYFYSGLGGYGAVRGNNSGFFALGLESGIQYPFAYSWVLDSGLFLGTGGGHGLSSSIGDGSFLESHLGLDYNFNYFLLGLAFSHWQFFDGELNNLNDNQILLNLTIPTDFSYWPGWASFQNNLFKNNFLNNNYQFSKNYFSITSSFYFPHFFNSQIKNISGEKLTSSIGLVGFEIGHYFKPTEPYFIFLTFNGAVSGNKNGYAEALGGLGAEYDLYQNSPFYLLSKISLGSGGGGDIDTGGGLIIKPELGLEYKPLDQLGIALTGTYLFSPGSSYQVWSLGLNLNYYFDLGYLGSLENTLFKKTPDYFDFNHFRIRLGNQLYIHPQHEDLNNSNNLNINLLDLKLDFFCNKFIYLTGQTAFAYTGNAAGYFSGLIGPGIQSASYHHTYIYAELLAGAAGGAGLDIGTGKMLEPLVGLGYQLTPAWSIYSSFGETLSPNNNLRTKTIDLGFAYGFSALSAQNN